MTERTQRKEKEETNEVNDQSIDFADWTFPDVDRRANERRQKSIDSLTTLVTALRWGTIAASLLWAGALHVGGRTLMIGLILVANATFRTFFPIEYRRRGWLSLLSILFELSIICGVVVSTRCWESPFIFSVFTPVIAAGFARGFWHSFRIGATAASAVSLASTLLGQTSSIKEIYAWCLELLLTAIIASYGKRILTRAEEVRALNLSQIWRLNEANDLLVNLNRLAHDLPASFDFTEVVERSVIQARSVAPSDLCALLTLDPVSPIWATASVEGEILSDLYETQSLPNAIRSILNQKHPQILNELNQHYNGLGTKSKSALYVPLWAGRRQVGLLALESETRNHFGLRHVNSLDQISETIALTIDNARWFDRLQARGAALERNRIARDLHDRIGQEIAYVAFELERLHQSAQKETLSDELKQLRNNARDIVKELRETLYDLRTDVTSEEHLIQVIQHFLNRVHERSGIHVYFEHSEQRKLPLATEREAWRIAQEAIVNAERHADATAINVQWEVDLSGAKLCVTDDGCGCEPELTRHKTLQENRPSYGITGMRERAESIGGLLQILPNPSGGTTVQLLLGSKRQSEIKTESKTKSITKEDANHV